jgi:uncharacterized protein YcsI (UPF0317 family)
MSASSERSGTSALSAPASDGSDAALRAGLAAPGSSGYEVRLACRSGALAGHTSGLAPGLAQANLVILPREYAFDFLAFCTRNPKPCPLLEVTEVGSPACPATAPAGCDLRTDLPRYRVWRHGKLAEEVTDIRHLWPDVHVSSGGGSSGAAAAGASGGPTAPAGAPPAPAPAADARCDWVGFLLGCSFSFEEALLAAGLPVRHLQENKPSADASSCGARSRSGSPEAGAPAGLCEPLAADPRNVPMYRTCVPTNPAGPFSGPLVVSMRPMTPAQAQQAASVTSAFQRVHGRPVYAGDAAGLGIADIGRPDYGDAVTIRPGACVRAVAPRGVLSCLVLLACLQCGGAETCAHRW